MIRKEGSSRGSSTCNCCGLACIGFLFSIGKSGSAPPLRPRLGQAYAAGPKQPTILDCGWLRKCAGANRSPPHSFLRYLLGRGYCRGQVLGLALVTHHFESALGFFISRRDFRLHLGGGLFHLWREAHVAVVLHAGSGRDEASDNDVLFQAAQVIDLAVDAGFGEHARGLLERRGGDEGVSGERSLGDAEEQRAAGGRLCPLANDGLV